MSLFPRYHSVCPLLLLISAFSLQAQVTGLSFRPADAKYSLALDRIVMISSNPNQLHIYNPVTLSDQQVALGEAPINLSLSPDGKYAAVAFQDAVVDVDLQAASVIHTYSSLVVGSTGYVVFGSGYIYVLPGYQGSRISINFTTGQITSESDNYKTDGVFDSLNSSIYNTQDGLSPDSLTRIDASAGVIGAGYTNYGYFGTYGVFGPLWLSRNGAVIYTGDGYVFSASADPTKDMRYLGTLPGLRLLQSLSTSDWLNQIAAVPSTGDYISPQQPTDAIVELFNSSSLNPMGQFATTPFVVNSTSFTAHGRWVFYNSASTNLFVITQADSTAGLERDFALENVSLGNTNSCNATFGSSSASVIAAGSFANAQVLSGEDCVFTVVSNTTWITLASGYYGSGNTTLSYLVRPNLSAVPRSGTISIGSQILAVNQENAIAPSAQTPLSIKPIAADYDTALDRVVMVASYPNELHLYDPVSQDDQIVPRIAAPISVSVRPDGLFAAVGHDGAISIVDLKLMQISQVIPVDMTVGGIVLAGNGYAYLFPQFAGYTDTFYSVLLSPVAITSSLTSFGGTTTPRLNASGTSIYSGATRFDITSGPSVIGDSSFNFFASNYWLSQDGNRMVASTGYVYFTSSVSSQDFGADGTLSATRNVAWAANSAAQHQTAVLSGDSVVAANSTNSQLQVYSDAGLQLQSQITMPSFSNGGTNYLSSGGSCFGMPPPQSCSLSPRQIAHLDCYQTMRSIRCQPRNPCPHAATR